MNMWPTLVKLGPLTVHAYGVMVALGFLAGILAARRFARREGIDPALILDLTLYVIIAALAGARLFYVIGQWDYFAAAPLEIFMVQNGGLVFLGGFLLAFAVIIAFARRKNIPLLKLLDVYFPAGMLGYAIGRIGCFLNGCCFGLPTTLPWGISFPAGSLAAVYLPGESLHPTQLYTVFLAGASFFILMVIYRKKKFDGQIFAWTLILYSAYRFSVEFFRYSPIHWLALTPSQWIVIPLFLFGLWSLKTLAKRV